MRSSTSHRTRPDSDHDQTRSKSDLEAAPHVAKVGQTQDRRHDPGEFLIPASDAKGHSERQWLRVQPGHDRMMDMLIASKKFPFRTKGDFMRWAVWTGFQVLEHMEPDLPSVTRQVDVIIGMVRDDEFRKEFEDTFKSIGERIALHMSEGREGEAKSLIAGMQAAIGQMPETGWRDRYEARFKKQFSAYLKVDKTKKFITDDTEV